MGSVQILANEPWFNLSLHPKHIAQSYRTYFRSILLYGAELLDWEDRKTLYEVDGKMLTTLFGRLLNLGRGRLSSKQRKRIQLAVEISSLEMDIDDLVRNRAETWLEIRSSRAPKVRYHACNSIYNIQGLQESHPLHRYLLNKVTETTANWKNSKRRGWNKMLDSCTGSGHISGSRQIISSTARLGSILPA